MLIRTIPLRLDEETVARLDRVAEVFTTRAFGLEATRSGVMRVALVRGLEILEEEFDVLARRPKKKTTKK